MDKELLGPIIGGAATIIAAVIGVVGVYIKKHQTSQNSEIKPLSKKKDKQLKSSNSTLDIPIPGNIPRDQLPGFRAADSIDSLRQSTQVRQISSEENQLSLWELPNGVFGYIETYKLDTPSMRLIDTTYIENNFNLNKGLRLSQNPRFGDSIEIHKSGNGNIYLVGFITEEDRIALQNPSRGQSVKVVISITKNKIRNKVIAIPRERLEWWRHRELGDGEPVADAMVS